MSWIYYLFPLNLKGRKRPNRSRLDSPKNPSAIIWAIEAISSAIPPTARFPPRGENGMDSIALTPEGELDRLSAG
jgi:hypothetical protein